MTLKKEAEKNIDIESNIKSSLQFTLTPSTINKKDDEGKENKAYQPINDIAEKLLEKDVKNIALTGPFGSGKSSILLTLEKDFPQYEYLNISLATLDCNNEIDYNITKKNIDLNTEISESIEKNISSNLKIQKQNEEDSLNRLIEYSILQQLIYREKPSEIPQSRFKRIKHISNRQSKVYTIGMILFVLACLVLFEPSILRVESLSNLLSSNKIWKIIWDSICLIYIIIAIFYFFKKIIIATYNNKLNKLNVKDGEIDISESTSIFNKYIDEIIYFFEVTKYDIVIIEDLDRYETHSIFLKLREINNLINNSKAIKRENDRQIVFIYAIKDDMFNDTSRTKFFDYITTVIPVINPSNSCDKLLISLQERGIDDITDKTCFDLGIFINDMRILKNIVNEFIQYRSKLDKKLKPENLLGMIIYKNYHPKDFAQLHNQEGVVFNVFKNKIKYYNSLVQDKENSISILTEEINQILNFYTAHTVKELRTQYVMKYIQKLHNVDSFSEIRNGTRHTLEEIIESTELFLLLENNEFKFYYNNYHGLMDLNLTFQKIENEVDSNFSYQKRLVMTPEKVDENKSKIEKTKQSISETRTLPLQLILKQYSSEDFFEDVEKNRLIAFLIKQGYIDESYYDYISHFYPGVMTASDRDFILDLKIGRIKETSYAIQKYEAVLEQIPSNAFVEGLTLNIGLIDYIVLHQDIYSNQLSWIINYLKRKKEFGFLETYYKQGTMQSVFFEEIFNHWKKFFTDGILKEDKLKTDINFEILLKYFPQQDIGRYKNTEFINYISTNFDIISSKIEILDFDNLEFIMKNLDIKFNNINVNDEISEKLISFISKGNHYSLTIDNISTILHYNNKELTEKLLKSNYSTILEINNENVINYVDSNINFCVANVFSEESEYEIENALINIAENNDIEDSTKKKYLSQQKNKIIDLSSINQNVWDISISSNVVSPTWENIEKYISTDLDIDFPSIIIDFIASNSNELSLKKAENLLSSKKVESKLFIELLGKNTLPLGSYAQIRKSFNRHFLSIDLSTLELDRMTILIKTEAIKFNDYYYNLINDDFATLLPEFIILNKSLYFSKINSFPLTTDITFSLLDNKKLTSNEKLIIIKTLKVAIFEGESPLSNLICTILNQAKKIIVDYNFIINIMNNCTNHSDKLNLFIKKCYDSNYDNSFLKMGLKTLGGNYEIIALQKGHKRKFSLTKEHKLLAEYLKLNNFVSKQFEENGLLRINSRII
jgi:hypothetical protein